MVQSPGNTNTSSTRQTACKQCGTCCTKGGPALHTADLVLLQDKLIPRQDLITLRKGEFAHNPVLNRVQATTEEIVKLKGREGEWTCWYYDPSTCGCTIYTHRPEACRILRCWDPEESLALVEKDLLSRVDILDGEDHLLKLVADYEKNCPLPDFDQVIMDIRKQPEKCIAALEEGVNRDIGFRDEAVSGSEIVLRQELFLFGRPLFQLLQPFGFSVFQSGNELHLRWRKK